MPNKEFTIYFHGKITVEAPNEAEATEEAYDTLNDAGGLQFTITSTEEGPCAECGGTGEVSADEPVYPDAGSPTASIGTRKCPCQDKGETDET